LKVDFLKVDFLVGSVSDNSGKYFENSSLKGCLVSYFFSP